MRGCHWTPVNFSMTAGIAAQSCGPSRATAAFIAPSGPSSVRPSNRVLPAVRHEAFVEKTRSEPDCLFYGFSFDGDVAYCREGYRDAESLLFHLDNVGALLAEALKISDITRLEVHALESQLALLREPLAFMNPQFFTLEMGFRRE